MKESYSKCCVETIIECSREHEEHCVKLANFIIPELRVVLARQRRDYGIGEEFQSTYPVDDQAPNVNDTPVNNLAMERLLGTIDYLLHKLKTLHAGSRSRVFSKTVDLRVTSDKSFKSFRQEVEKKAEVSLKWNERMKEKFSKGMDEKRVIAYQHKRKRFEMLEKLKEMKLTNADEVEIFVNDTKISNELKAKRLKLEMKFARDSSKTLPKSDRIFRIQVTLPNMKRRDKSAVQFADSLVADLGRKTDKKAIDYHLFSKSLENCTKL